LLAKPSPLNINLGSDRFSMFNKKAGHPREPERLHREHVVIITTIAIVALMQLILALVMLAHWPGG
jgi:hypothetical protein